MHLWITLAIFFASLGTRLSPKQERHEITRVKKRIRTLFSAADKYRSNLSRTEGEQLNETIKRVQSGFRETVTESTTAKSYLFFVAVYVCVVIIDKRDYNCRSTVKHMKFPLKKIT